MVKHMQVLSYIILLIVLFNSFSDIIENGFAIDIYQNEDEIILRYTYNMTYSLNINASNSGDLRLSWIMPKNNSYQRIYSLEYNENVAEYTQDEHNNIFAVFTFSFNQSDEIVLTMSYVFDSFYDVDLSGKNVEIIYNLTDPIFIKYTSSQQFIQANDEKIIEKANELVGNIQDPIEKAQVLNQWVYNNLEWTGYESELRGDLWALENLEGDCSEFAVLFISLCRANGIPSRLVHGIADTMLMSGGTFTVADVAHDWAEIYLPDIGWVWVDPTYGWFDGGDGIHQSYQSDFNSQVLGSGYRYSWIGTIVNVTESFFITPISISSEPDLEPVLNPEPEEKDGSIPGFPYLSIAIGFIIVLLLRDRFHI